MWLAVALAAHLQTSLVSTPPWRDHGTKQQVKVESQAVEHSAFKLFRVTTTINLDAESLLAVVWGEGIAEEVTSPYVQQHDLLESERDKRIIYEVVSAPMVTDRDYVAQSTKQQMLGGGFEILTRTIDDARVPRHPDRVRMKMHSRCALAPNVDGSTTLTYELYTDVGGSVPGWMVESAQEEAIVEWAQSMRQRAQAKAQQIRKTTLIQ